MDTCYLNKEECNLKQTKDDSLLNVWPKIIAETMVYDIFLINCFIFDIAVQSVSWILAEFYFNRGLQRLYTGTCIILQKTINGFLCLLIVFLKSKTYQLILKDVIKLNRNLR